MAQDVQNIGQGEGVAAGVGGVAEPFEGLPVGRQAAHGVADKLFLGVGHGRVRPIHGRGEHLFELILPEVVELVGVSGVGLMIQLDDLVTAVGKDQPLTARLN